MLYDGLVPVALCVHVAIDEEDERYDLSEPLVIRASTRICEFVQGLCHSAVAGSLDVHLPSSCEHGHDAGVEATFAEFAVARLREFSTQEAWLKKDRLPLSASPKQLGLLPGAQLWLHVPWLDALAQPTRRTPLDDFGLASTANAPHRAFVMTLLPERLPIQVRVVIEGAVSSQRVEMRLEPTVCDCVFVLKKMLMEQAGAPTTSKSLPPPPPLTTTHSPGCHHPLSPPHAGLAAPTTTHHHTQAWLPPLPVKSSCSR